MKVISVADFCNIPVQSRREMIAEELENAAMLLREGVVLESVAWRLADAVADFVALVEKHNPRKVGGAHSYSGKGGKLVRKTP
jgi:hypothetical protein